MVQHEGVIARPHPSPSSSSSTLPQRSDDKMPSSIKHAVVAPIITESRELHCTRHADNRLRGTCFRCRCYHMEDRWRILAKWCHTVANNEYVGWPRFHTNPRSAALGDGCAQANVNTSFGRFEVRTSAVIAKVQLLRLAKSRTHQAAQKAWEEARTVPVALATESPAQCKRDPNTNFGAAHVLCMLAAVRTNTSFRSWESCMHIVLLWGGGCCSGEHVKVTVYACNCCIACT